MSATCQQAAEQVGTGIAAALTAVDCVANEVSAQAFGRLFAPGGAMASVLTIVLTLFVAIFAILLLTGRANVSVRSLTPRMITLGMVLTFATSWLAYQSVVWNLFVAAPDWLAGVLTGSGGSATRTFAAKIDVVFQAIQQASGEQNDISAFSPPGMMWMGAMLFLLGTVGLLVTARIALAVLVALGPIFVVMALFNGTRGLFTGWVKGLTMLALVPLFAVLGGSVMLELAVPLLAALVATPGQPDPQAAMGFFLVGAVHVALMFLVLKTAATMVSGWTVFGLAGADRSETGSRRGEPARADRASLPPAAAQAQQASQTIAAARRIDVSAPAVAGAANDMGASQSPGRTTRVFATSSPSAQVKPLSGGPSRVSGVGSRFRAANTRSTEKFR